MSKLLFNVLGNFAEFERALLKERQREGIAIAKKNGLYKGRKPSCACLCWSPSKGYIVWGCWELKRKFRLTK